MPRRSFRTAAVTHRSQSRACQEALLGQLRSLLYVFRFSGNRRWRKVRFRSESGTFCFHVSDLMLGS
jgi:hypothetical protein